MHFQIVNLLFLSSLVAGGQVGKVKHEDQSYLLVARDGYCQGTCASCFGAGNIICEGIMCYNPSAGEQCCADGTYCVGSDTSCCGSVGAGTGSDDSATTGTDVLPTATDASSATLTDSFPTSTPSSWNCNSSDTPEECCARPGSDTKFCYGDGTIFDIVCYVPSDGDECCEFGYTCNGSGCCDEVGYSQITPSATSFYTYSSTGTASLTGIGGLTPAQTTGSSNDEPSTTTSSLSSSTSAAGNSGVPPIAGGTATIPSVGMGMYVAGVLALVGVIAVL